jgi:hypothetical protein
MGVGTKRWQIWLITMFILTGIIGMFQLFEGPKSDGAVTVAGGAVNPPIALPEHSLQATELPAWQPSADESQSSAPQPTTVVATRPAAVTTHPAATQTAAPTQTAQVTRPPLATTQAPTIKAPVIPAKSVSTTPKATTTQPKATTAQPRVPATPTVVKSTATAIPTRPTSSWPTCTRMWFWWLPCR